MKYRDLVQGFNHLPIIESSALRLYVRDHKALAVQLSRWVKAGRLLRLRRGSYLLPEFLRRDPVLPEHIANLLVRPSYVSLERALAIHGLIPESVPLLTSVTSGRPQSLSTPVGQFSYRHVKPAWFFGYREQELGQGSALVATPEKALLDLVYLSSGEFGPERIGELRLQNTEMLDLAELVHLAEQRAGPRVQRAARELALCIKADQNNYKEP